MSMTTAKHLARILSQAHTTQLLVSGGGEPFDNLPPILLILKDCSTLETVVVHTSGNWARSASECEKILSTLSEHATSIRNELGLKSVRFVLRLSVDEFHLGRVPISNIHRILEWFLANKTEAFTVMVRGLIHETSSLAHHLSTIGVKIDPLHKQPKNVESYMVQWGSLETLAFPIVYRPIFAAGRASKLDFEVENQEIVRCDNPCIRGLNGEGMDFYGSIIGLSGENSSHDSTFKHCSRADGPSTVGLSLYCDPGGRISINGGAPDNHVDVKMSGDWTELRHTLLSDPLNAFLVLFGPSSLVSLVEIFDQHAAKKARTLKFGFSRSLSLMVRREQRRFLRKVASDVLSRVQMEDDVSFNEFGNTEINRLLSEEHIDRGCRTPDLSPGAIPKTDPFRGNIGSIWGSN